MTRTAPIAPEALAAQFCGDWREEADGTRTASGFCGFTGGRGHGFDGHCGYDDGYEWMSDLLGRGWRPLPEKGDWPYLVYLSWPSAPGGRPAIAEYCEADLTIWTFPDVAAAKLHYRGLKDEGEVDSQDEIQPEPDPFDAHNDR